MSDSVYASTCESKAPKEPLTKNQMFLNQRFSGAAISLHSGWECPGISGNGDVYISLFYINNEI